jgi:hypothetical protein
VSNQDLARVRVGQVSDLGSDLSSELVITLTTSRAAYHENRRALHPQQEIELIQCIDQISKQGLPPSRDIVRRLASQLAQKELRYH